MFIPLFNKERSQEEKCLWPTNALKCLWGHRYHGLQQDSVETELHSKHFSSLNSTKKTVLLPSENQFFCFSMGFLNLSSNGHSDLFFIESPSFPHHFCGSITAGSLSFEHSNTVFLLLSALMPSIVFSPSYWWVTPLMVKNPFFCAGPFCSRLIQEHSPSLLYIHIFLISPLCT